MSEELEIGENPDLKKTVEQDNELKKFVINYVGQDLDPEDGNITVEMIVEVFAKDFPEFLLVVAEENWIRGYRQAFLDMEAHDKEMTEAEAKSASTGDENE